MDRPRKSYVLRIPQELYDIYEAWASDELRSVNAQFAAVLMDGARRAGRLRRSSSAMPEGPPRRSPPDAG